jgi:hypothetical protein
MNMISGALRAEHSEKYLPERGSVFPSEHPHYVEKVAVQLVIRRLDSGYVRRSRRPG